MVKDFLVSLTLDLILLLFPNTMAQILAYTKQTNKQNSCQIAGISQAKVQEVYQNVQSYPREGPEGQLATLRLFCP